MRRCRLLGGLKLGWRCATLASAGGLRSGHRQAAAPFRPAKNQRGARCCTATCGCCIKARSFQRRRRPTAVDEELPRPPPPYGAPGGLLKLALHAQQEQRVKGVDHCEAQVEPVAAGAAAAGGGQGGQVGAVRHVLRGRPGTQLQRGFGVRWNRTQARPAGRPEAAQRALGRGPRRCRRAVDRGCPARCCLPVLGLNLT